MGNRRVCNCGDTLKDPYAYPLMVQVTDSAGNGINGDTVFFSADYGKFGNSTQVGFITNTVEYVDSTLDCIAAPSGDFPYIFPNEPHDIVITIEAMKGTNIWATKQVLLKCFSDPELSGLNPPKCHETTDTLNKNVEIPGDGYNDGTGKKTIRVEIDYDADIVNQGLVEDFIVVTKKILATARIDTADANFVINDGFSGPDVLDKLTVKTLLATYRNYRDYIHLIIGSKRENFAGFGEVISYVDPAWGNFSHTKCAHSASTDSAIAQTYLDSAGIFIYGQQIEDAMADEDWDTLYHYHWIPIDNTYGICIAHEIGHALGISSHDSLVGVMRNINFHKNAYDWMYFVDTLLNKKPPYDAMNTRDVLGIHTIDIGW